MPKSVIKFATILCAVVIGITYNVKSVNSQPTPCENVLIEIELGGYSCFTVPYHTTTTSQNIAFYYYVGGVSGIQVSSFGGGLASCGGEKSCDGSTTQADCLVSGVAYVFPDPPVSNRILEVIYSQGCSCPTQNCPPPTFPDAELWATCYCFTSSSETENFDIPCYR